MRQPISNEAFSAERMYGKALRGGYPSAEYQSKHREGELAYWRQRCEAEEVNTAAVERAYEAERRAKASRARSGRR